jgi:RHS repeat-associated protein
VYESGGGGRYTVRGVGGEVLAVYGGTTLQYHDLGVGRREASGAQVAYVRDHLGSVRVGVEPGGTVRSVEDYYPFGLEMAGRVYVQGAPTKEDFTGYEKDAETGMLYAGARLYMPAYGRFTSTDRFKEKYPSLSPYQYAANNPLTNIDVNGDSVVVIFRRIQGGVIENVNVHHAALVWYDESNPEAGGVNIAEAFNSGTAFRPGKLVRDQMTSADSPSIVGTQLIEVPEGMTESEFVQGLQASADSYDGQTNYPVGGNAVGCAGRAPCANSNSFIGNILRQNGVDVNPALPAPMWNTDALPGDRRESAPPRPGPIKRVIRDWLNQAGGNHQER